MGVSYHLVSVNKDNGTFENLFLKSGIRLDNQLNKLANLMIQYPDRILDFFEKDRTYFDFIFGLLEEEISSSTFNPELIKEKLLYIQDTFKSKDSFPIHRFNYFDYGGIKLFNFLNVTINGAEINKIATDKNYLDSAIYDLKTSFDIFNNYRTSGRQFYQGNPVIYLNDNENNRITNSLDLNAFPSKISIIKPERDYGFGQEITEVNLVLKSPSEHFEEELSNLISICEECINHDLGIKTYVEC